jgi:hypothetical protein
MKFKELKQQIKEEQKQIAKEIRIGKDGRKPKNYNPEHAKYYNTLYSNRINYRHRHIAYCTMFNNTPYEKIENPRESNPANMKRIEKIREEWRSMLDEDPLLLLEVEVDEAIRCSA